MHIVGQCLQIVERLLCAQISGAQNVMDTPRHQQFLELGRQTAASMRNVQIAKNQHQLCKWGATRSGDFCGPLLSASLTMLIANLVGFVKTILFCRY